MDKHMNPVNAPLGARINTMSKMSELDIKIQEATAEAVTALTEWVWEHLHADGVTYPLYKDEWANVFETWFDGSEDDSCPYDYIGEALSRREECVALIDQRGDLSLEITALKDELLEKDTRLIRQGEQLAARNLEIANLMDECIALRAEVRVKPNTTGIADTAEEVPANGYVKLNWEDGSWQKRGSLDEFIGEGAVVNYEVFELGAQYKSKRQTVWTEVSDD